MFLRSYIFNILYFFTQLLKQFAVFTRQVITKATTQVQHALYYQISDSVIRTRLYQYRNKIVTHCNTYL